MMFCGRKDCSKCKFFKRDGCVTVPECAYKDLKEKLETAKEALRWITNCKPIIDCGYFEIMEKARETLEEIENAK